MAALHFCHGLIILAAKLLWAIYHGLVALRCSCVIALYGKLFVCFHLCMQSTFIMYHGQIILAAKLP